MDPTLVGVLLGAGTTTVLTVAGFSVKAIASKKNGYVKIADFQRLYLEQREWTSEKIDELEGKMDGLYLKVDSTSSVLHEKINEVGKAVARIEGAMGA